MGLCLKLKRESLRCILPNFLKRFRKGFIGQNRRRPASLSIAAGQRRPKIRLSWRESSLPGLLSPLAWGLLPIISVLDDSRQREQHAPRDEERFLVSAPKNLTEFFRNRKERYTSRGEFDSFKDPRMRDRRRKRRLVA